MILSKRAWTNTVRDRAHNGLHDYLIWLRDKGDNSDRGGKPDKWSRIFKSGISESRDTIRDAKLGELSKQTLLADREWFGAIECKWKNQKRINRHGYLMPKKSQGPWTIRRISKSFPKLSVRYQVALLINLNGTIGGRTVEKDQVVDIVDQAVERTVRREIARIFSQVSLGQIIAPTPEEEKKDDLPPPRKSGRYGPRRVRDPKTGALISKEERDKRRTEAETTEPVGQGTTHDPKA